MAYTVNSVVCEVLLVTATTTEQELYDFGVIYAWRAEDGTMNIGLDREETQGSFNGTDVYVVKTISSPFRKFPTFDFVTPAEFDGFYTEVSS